MKPPDPPFVWPLFCSYSHNNTEWPDHGVAADWLMEDEDGRWFPVCANDAPFWWSARTWRYEDDTPVSWRQCWPLPDRVL